MKKWSRKDKKYAKKEEMETEDSQKNNNKEESKLDKVRKHQLNKWMDRKEGDDEEAIKIEGKKKIAKNDHVGNENSKEDHANQKSEVNKVKKNKCVNETDKNDTSNEGVFKIKGKKKLAKKSRHRKWRC